jgi:YVTN family beta-propeller protein
VASRAKNPTDITVGTSPFGVAITPDGTTAYVANSGSGSVSTIDVATRTKNPTDITVGAGPGTVAITPCHLGAVVGTDGRTITVTGSAFTPSATLTLSIASTPQTLATVTTSPTGTFSQSFTVPCSVDAGAHTITATGPNNSVATTSVALGPCALVIQPRFTG